jgi:Tol biopolymer transport system component
MRRFLLCAAAMTGLLGSLVVAPANATFAGREGKITFVRSNQVYTVAKGGGTVKQLTTSGKNYRPKWSLDGKRIAYINETTTGVKDIWTMTATGTKKTRVTTTGNVTSNPAWSPDGKLIAYAAGTRCAAAPPIFCGNPGYTIRSTAPFGAPQLLGISVDRYLAWSPDGTHLAVFNDDSQDSPDYGLHFYYPATGQDDVIAATGSDGAGYADWSDLAFGPTGAFGYGEVYRGDDGGMDPPAVRIIYPCARARWTCLPTDPGTFTTIQGDRSPAPSPSNAHMAFTNDSSGTPKIYTSTITGQSRKLIVTNGYQPDWQSLH